MFLGPILSECLAEQLSVPTTPLPEAHPLERRHFSRSDQHRFRQMPSRAVAASAPGGTIPLVYLGLHRSEPGLF
jgi:hypothetical protein